MSVDIERLRESIRADMAPVSASAVLALIDRLEAAERLYSEAPRLLGDLEYAAHNLCDETESDVSRVMESTCPETTLLIAIRDMRLLIEEPRQ